MVKISIAAFIYHLVRPGGAYMPCALFKDVAVQAGLYPEGNLAGRSFSEVVADGDQAFFARLESMRVTHHTALDSLVYHTKEGEMEAGSGA